MAGHFNPFALANGHCLEHLFFKALSAVGRGIILGAIC